ncbi:MAG: AI-2E family transporter [Sphingomicrobium sp.]
MGVDPAPPPHIERPGPAEFRDPLARTELKRATVWIGAALFVVGIITLAQPLMLIVGGLVFSVILDGATRLLGRVLPVRRGIRLFIVILASLSFLAWVGWFAGTTLAAQAETLRQVVTVQVDRLLAWAVGFGLMPKGASLNLPAELSGSIGRLTSAVRDSVGVVTSGILILVLGGFIAGEPHLYDRGVAWMLPIRFRERFYAITARIGATLRRLLLGRFIGMTFEGMLTFVLLQVGGVPMAALLGLITGLFAFVPNVGAIISGLLMVAVGFSAGSHQGLWAVFVYFFVHNFEGYVVVPYVARRTVDLPPALVLAAQLIMGALFGILGLLLADPVLAAVKVTLEDVSRIRADDSLAKPGEPIA